MLVESIFVCDMHLAQGALPSNDTVDAVQVTPVRLNDGRRLIDSLALCGDKQAVAVGDRTLEVVLSDILVNERASDTRYAVTRLEMLHDIRA